MAMLTSAFAYLGSYYSEANPSLQGLRALYAKMNGFLVNRYLGQTLFTKGDTVSLANMDKQIYRLLGKATTLAAYVLRGEIFHLSFHRLMVCQNGLSCPSRP